MQMLQLKLKIENSPLIHRTVQYFTYINVYVTYNVTTYNYVQIDEFFYASFNLQNTYLFTSHNTLKETANATGSLYSLF